MSTDQRRQNVRELRKRIEAEQRSWAQIEDDELRALDEQELRDYLDGDGSGETITAEAERLVYGDRDDDYGHPRDNFTTTAILWTALLRPKLADGEHIEPEDVARCMVGVKLARDVHTPKRDNRVDGAGYFLTLDRLATGR